MILNIHMHHNDKVHTKNFIIIFWLIPIRFFSLCEDISFGLANLHLSLKQLPNYAIYFYLCITWVSLPMSIYIVVASQTTQPSICILGAFKRPTSWISSKPKLFNPKQHWLLIIFISLLWGMTNYSQKSSYIFEVGKV